MGESLEEAGLKNIGKILPNKGKGPVSITADIAQDADLAAIAKKVNAAETPHRKESPPRFTLVVFAPKLASFNDRKTAIDSLGQVKGVDAKKTRILKGRIFVRITEKGKVTTAKILAALKKAKINVTLTQAKKKK